MDNVIVVIPIIRQKAILTDAEVVEQMTSALQGLINLGGLKGNLDDIIIDYSFDKDAGYINVTVPSTCIGLTNKFNTVGAGLSPTVTYQVSEEIAKEALNTVPNNGFKLFSAATIQERLRLALKNPRMRFRYTIMDYKRYYNSKKSKLIADEKQGTAFKNMFLTDVNSMITEALPFIEEGKQLNTLVGVSQVSPKLAKVARELSIIYKRGLKQQKQAGAMNKSIFKQLKQKYTDFMVELMKVVFPDLVTDDNDGVSDKVTEQTTTKSYSHTSDGRIDLFADPTPEQLERKAESDAKLEETRALTEDLTHDEENSQKEYSKKDYAVYADGTCKKTLFKGTKEDCEDYVDDNTERLQAQYPNHVIEAVKTKSRTFSEDTSNKYKILTWDATNPQHAWVSGSIDITANSIKEAREIAKRKYGRYDDNGDFEYKVVKSDDKESIDNWKNKHDDSRSGVFSESHMPRTFSDGMKEVTFRTTNPEQLTKIVNAIGECGNGGHTFDIIIDPDLSEADGGSKKFQWDGDGSDRVEVSKGKTFSNNSDIRKEAKRLFKIFNPKATDAEIEKLIDFGLGLAANPQDLIDSLKDNLKKQGKTFSSDSDNYYVVVHQNGVVDSWFGPYFKDEANKVEDELANELEFGFTVGVWSLDTLLSKLNKQRKGNYTPDQINSHAEKRSFSTITNADDFRKYAHKVMQNAQGDNYSPEVTDKVVDDLIADNPNADFGELISRLTSGLGD